MRPLFSLRRLEANPPLREHGVIRIKGISQPHDRQKEGSREREIEIKMGNTIKDQGSSAMRPEAKRPPEKVIRTEGMVWYGRDEDLPFPKEPRLATMGTVLPAEMAILRKTQEEKGIGVFFLCKTKKKEKKKKKGGKNHINPVVPSRHMK